MSQLIFAAEFTKNTGETITWKAESVAVVVTVTKKGQRSSLLRTTTSLSEEKIG